MVGTLDGGQIGMAPIILFFYFYSKLILSVNRFNHGLVTAGNLIRTIDQLPRM